MIQFTSSVFEENTKKTYGTHRNSYLQFCNKLGYSPVPASSTTLCRYAAFLAKTLKYNSVKQYLNIVCILPNAEWGLPSPLQNDFALNCTLRGIRRSLGDTVNRKLPITPSLLRKIQRHLNLNSSADATVWAVSFCMFYGLLRKSNVIPDKFIADKHLRWHDVKLFSWHASLLIVFAH